ncbi:MAG: ATP-binding protein [Anaerolineales bacterium]
MNTLSGLLILLLLLAALLMTWRWLALRRAIAAYARAIRRDASAENAPLSLDSDSRELDSLSGAVAALMAAGRQKQLSLQAEHARLAALLDQMTDGVLIADAAGRVTFANPAAERLFELAPAAGHSVVEVLRHHQLAETWRLSVKTSQPQSETVELSARRQYIQLIVLPDRDNPGGSLLLAQNFTRLRQLETIRRDFISNLSHELRTPLASLKALTETLSEGALEDPSAARRFLRRIEAEVDALAQMAAELLDLSRIEAGQVTLNRAKSDPVRLLQSAAERMSAQVARAALSLRVDCPAELPPVSADTPRVEQILVNLIHNAVKFTPPGGEITLSAQRVGDFVQFSVRDSGAGIPEEALPRVFERFYRADRSRSGGGTGLGLAIVRHLVEAHGGQVGVRSRQGEGALFFFTIPLVA